MKYLDKNGNKTSLFIRYFVFFFVFISAITIIGINSVNNSIIAEDETIQNFYQKASEEFEKGNLREMQIQLGRLQREFPNEDVQPFINEKISSLPMVQASNLIEEYKTNVVNANLNYEDKYLIVSGKVTEIGQDITKTVFITLGNDSHTFYDVRCEFEYEEEISQVANLKKGDIVTVLGLYKDITSICPRLEKCYVLN